MNPLFLHNTLSGKKEEFKPIKKGTVSMYHCGPTVYDTAHIGNLRTFIFNDIVRRVFEYDGYKVTQAMNITDVDDKTIRRSRESGVSLEALTSKYESLFFENSDELDLLKPHIVMSARGYIAEMIVMIETLLQKGVAYAAKDGIYMSIGKVEGYGALARLDTSHDTSGNATKTGGLRERISNDEYDKENPHDFALWKFSTPEDSDGTEAIVAWDAPFGKGRPGWSIECSAMAIKALGETIDIHTGGTDLIFPHHTNEIAQSEAATGKPFVHYWLHGGFMNVNDVKMAKSKGNFLKLADLTENGIAPIAFRYWLLTAHYRSQINFTFEAVEAAQVALFKLCQDMIEWIEDTDIKKTRDLSNIHTKYQQEFEKAINDDFNMPQAVAIMWNVVKDTSLSPTEKRATVLDFDRVFGLRLSELAPVPKTTIPLEIVALSDAREAARLAKEWQKADALRTEIESRGYMVKDSDNGPTIEEM